MTFQVPYELCLAWKKQLFCDQFRTGLIISKGPTGKLFLGPYFRHANAMTSAKLVVLLART